MPEILTSPARFQILYCERDRWNMTELYKSACGSYYSAAGSFVYDILHECQTVRDLLNRYGILTVIFDDRHVILNRGRAVEQLEALVAGQEENYDSYYTLQQSSADSSLKRIT